MSSGFKKIIKGDELYLYNSKGQLIYKRWLKNDYSIVFDVMTYGRNTLKSINKKNMINIIVAKSENNVIGKDNKLPWHLPKDMAYFKEKTKNSIVIMGRKCWESIPEKYRPLPNRENIVLTRNKEYKAEGATVIHNLNHFLSDNYDNEKDIWIIGGSDVYKAGFLYADFVYITNIQATVDGDVFLEDFNPKEWVKVDNEGYNEIYEENGFKFTFDKYINV